jgi:diguanylate cyclase (GGDEF)-like protein
MSIDTENICFDNIKPTIYYFIGKYYGKQQMKSFESGRLTDSHDYCGQILTGAYSKKLKQRIADTTTIFRHFDLMGTPAIPYIAAWREYQKTIWYEFISRHFLRMMACEPAQGARVFRNSLLEQRIYEHQPASQRVIENIVNPEDLAGSRTNYRREVKRKGITEAVYKCKISNGDVIWLKDQAVIEAYSEDQVYLSFGCLTIVSKEMEADEARKQMEKVLRKSEERFRYQAIHDDLTGLYNTRFLYRDLDRLIKSSRPKKQTFSLIFLDIDDFKNVVDTYGHLYASHAIRELGATILASIKKPAYGVAYGGDEFIVVLPDFNKEQAIDKAEHIRSLMRQTVYLTSRGLEVKLHASFGVATFPDDADNQTELIGLADRAMFGVKASGKNAVKDIRSTAPVENETD